jgi:hypothetical protein
VVVLDIGIMAETVEVNGDKSKTQRQDSLNVRYTSFSTTTQTGQDINLSRKKQQEGEYISL